MNIAMVNNHAYIRGGAERVMFEEMEWLHERGDTVRVFSRKNDISTGLRDEDLFPPKVDFQSTSALTKISTAVNIIHNRRSGGLFRQFCERSQPDIAHCHNIYAGLTTAMLDVCRSIGIPSILTLHDYKLICPTYSSLCHGTVCTACEGGKFYHCLLKRCHKSSYQASLVSTVESYFNRWFGKYLQAHFIVVPSRFMFDRMIKNGIPSQKLRYIPNGVAHQRFSPVYDGRYLLYVGRLAREKGLRTLIEASAGSGVDLRIVGDGPEREPLQQWVKDCRADHISFLGYQSGAQLRDTIGGAAIVVVPSEWHENASMVILEAMACGKPVIASRMGGIPEQVEDGQTGLLFDAGNVEGLRHAIQTLVSDPERRRYMGCAARQRVEEHFSLDHHCTQLAALYQEAIRGFSPGKIPLVAPG
jgi:glycosyltransferase involved in cell wall biosynthesis